MKSHPGMSIAMVSIMHDSAREQEFQTGEGEASENIEDFWSAPEKMVEHPLILEFEF